MGTDISSAETEGSYVPRESLPAERSLTTIASVRLVRQGDTRQSLFPAFENGDQVTLSQPQPVSALDATAGRSATFAAGQAFIGQEGEWVAHAAWHTEDGGMPEFFGPCASEFSTALETVAAGFGRSPDADFMVDLIARATEPGFLADVDLQFREDYSRFALDPGSVPPMMFNRLAQVFVHVSLSGAGESTFAVRSLSGYGALTVVNGDGTLTALIDRSGPIDVVSTNFNQTENSVLATVPAEVVGELEVLHVDANLESAEATYEMISLTELSARTGTPAEQLRVELDQINANISRSTEIANPFFTT